MVVCLAIALAGALMVIAGSFMTWATATVPIVGVITVGGFDEGRQGSWTLSGAIAAAVSCGWGLWGRARGVASGVTAALGGLILAVGINEARDLQEWRDRLALARALTFGLIQLHVETGLVLVLVGGALVTAGGAGATSLQVYRMARQRRGATPLAAAGRDHPG